MREIEQAPSLAALWALTVRVFRAEGFGAFGYIVWDDEQRGQAKALLSHGFSNELVSAYSEMGYGRHDPTSRVAMATGRPTFRNSVPDQYRLSRNEFQHRTTLSELGLSEVLNLPLFGPDGRNASFALAQPCDSGLFARINIPVLHMLAQAGHLKAFSLRPSEPVQGHGLSAREVEILRWAAQGKSNTVIADILAISTGTVDTYLRRIFDKLDVADRTSAAVKGFSLGLIGV